jgi:hypothetical protein
MGTPASKSSETSIMLVDNDAYPFLKEYDNTQGMEFDMQMELLGLTEVKPEEIINGLCCSSNQ